MKFPANRSLACITIGRANLDLYPPVKQQLVAARSYDAFVGGSPANIAAGLVRRGLTAGIITKLADDGIGDFVVGYLQNFGIDVSRVLRESSTARTSLAFVERRRDAQSVFYRQGPSDLLLEAQEIDSTYLASSQVLFLSGSALAQEPCRSAVQTAVTAAKSAGTVVAMDIDYRPYGWDVSPCEIIGHFARQCDLLIGTAEEFCLASGLDPASEIKRKDDGYFLQCFSQAELLVVKRGREGANAYQKKGEEVTGALLPAALQKPWGAGDAFASSLLASLLLGKDLAAAMLDAAASASLNISGLSCTEAMPSSGEIARFIEQWRSGDLPPEWVD